MKFFQKKSIVTLKNNFMLQSLRKTGYIYAPYVPLFTSDPLPKSVQLIPTHCFALEIHNPYAHIITP